MKKSINIIPVFLFLLTNQFTAQDFTHYYPFDEHNDIQASLADDEGNIWFGTRKGVSKFNGISWITYTTEDGLPYNRVTAIEADKSGNLWLATGDCIWLKRIKGVK